MKLFIFNLLLWICLSCSVPKEEQFESCIKKRVEKEGAILTYFLQTKQRYIGKDLLLKKIKVTLKLPSGEEVSRKDSILFKKMPDGSWNCLEVDQF